MAVIGFIGLGNMGAPMAANLVKAGHRVIGYDVNAAAVQALASAGVQAADSAADAARGADVVITMLPAGEHVRDVWLHQGGLIEAVKGSAPLLIDSSTIDVESARVVTEAARVAGFEMLDAPVSGGVGGATAATLAANRWIGSDPDRDSEVLRWQRSASSDWATWVRRWRPIL